MRPNIQHDIEAIHQENSSGLNQHSKCHTQITLFPQEVEKRKCRPTTEGRKREKVAKNYRPIRTKQTSRHIKPSHRPGIPPLNL